MTSSRYHISEDGQVRPCKASSAESCTAKGPTGEKAEHFDSLEGGRARAEELLMEEYGGFLTVSKEEDEERITLLSGTREEEERKWKEAGITGSYERPRYSFNGVEREITQVEAVLISEPSPFQKGIIEDIGEKYQRRDFLEDNLLDSWAYDLDEFATKEEQLEKLDMFELEELGARKDYYKEELAETVKEHHLPISGDDEVTLFHKEDDELRSEANYIALQTAFDEAGIEYRADGDKITADLSNLTNVQGEEIGELLTAVRDYGVLDDSLYSEMEVERGREGE